MLKGYISSDMRPFYVLVCDVELFCKKLVVLVNGNSAYASAEEMDIISQITIIHIRETNVKHLQHFFCGAMPVFAR